MNPFTVLFVAVVSYLVGAVSFARIITRIKAPQLDLTKTAMDVEGSGEQFRMDFASATTVSVNLGPRLGFLTVVLDMLKVALTTLVFRYLYPEAPYFLVAAISAMIGHIWPVYYSFKGGRGLSALYGALFVIDWLAVPACAAGGTVLGVFILRDVLAGYVIGPWLVIPWLWFRTHDPAHLAYGIAAAVLFTLAFMPQITQYISLKRGRKDADVEEIMQVTGMGRGIYKMGVKFGVFKERSGPTRISLSR